MDHDTAVFGGIDVGSSTTKAVLLDGQGEVQGFSVIASKTDFKQAARECFELALDNGRVSLNQVRAVFSTGYGRDNVEFAVDTKTEISCHGRGCYHYFPRELSIIDVGGQDNKIIHLRADGRRRGFKMNRKCAAGTGAFLEEMSTRLHIPLGDMNGFAAQATGLVELGSFCTVFAATEVLNHIRNNKKVPDIVKGIYLSMIKRVLEMDTLLASVAMTGGVVAHNPYFVKMTEELIGTPVLVPRYPQLAGALGAALYAKETE